MSKANLTIAQIDSTGEVLDIGMGSAAAAISMILSKQVSIKFSSIQLQQVEKLNITGYNDGLLVGFDYTKGLSGRELVLMRKMDVKAILDLLMSNENDSDEEFSFDELSLSTSQEIINQMINSGNGSMSQFMGLTIETSPSQASIFKGVESVSNELGVNISDNIIQVIFKIEIDGVISSDFQVLIKTDTAVVIAGKIIKNEPKSNTDMIIERSETVSYNTAVPVNDLLSNRINKDSAIKQNCYNVHETQFPDFSDSGSKYMVNSPALKNNIDLLMDVPLNVTIEIGKTRIKMKEVMNFSKGTIISLEKQAGAPVDVVVNGQLIARGDVVVIDDNFAVRITDIVGDNTFTDKNKVK